MNSGKWLACTFVLTSFMCSYQLLAARPFASSSGNRKSRKSSVFSLFNLKDKSKFWSETVIRGGMSNLLIFVTSKLIRSLIMVIANGLLFCFTLLTHCLFMCLDFDDLESSTTEKMSVVNYTKAGNDMHLTSEEFLFSQCNKYCDSWGLLALLIFILRLGRELVRCHISGGVRGVRWKIEFLLGWKSSWESDKSSKISKFLMQYSSVISPISAQQHNTDGFMPDTEPFEISFNLHLGNSSPCWFLSTFLKLLYSFPCMFLLTNENVESFFFDLHTVIYVFGGEVL